MSDCRALYATSPSIVQYRGGELARPRSPALLSRDTVHTCGISTLPLSFSLHLYMCLTRARLHHQTLRYPQRGGAVTRQKEYWNTCLACAYLLHLKHLVHLNLADLKHRENGGRGYTIYDERRHRCSLFLPFSPVFNVRLVAC